MTETHGRPLALLLPGPRLPRLRPTRSRKPVRLRPLRQAESHPPALLQRLQGPLLRAQRHPTVRLPHARGEGPLRTPSPRRGQRHPTDRAPRRRPSRYRRPLGPHRRRSCPRRSRRVRGFFPLERARSNSTRPGRSSRRSRRTATRPTRPTTTRGIGGTMSPTTPSTSWSWRATVRKERKEGQVVSIRRTVVLGDERAVEEVLKTSVCSRTINKSGRED